MPSNNTTNRVKFTTGRVSRFTCPVGKAEAKLWDSDVKSLIVRARPTGSKAYFFQGRLHGKMIRIKIADVSENGMTLEDARTKALEYQSAVSAKRDPRLEIRNKVAAEKAELKQIAQESIKFKEVWDAYIDANKDGWSATHLGDHYKAMQSFGRKRQRSNLKTVAGVLYRFRSTNLGEFDSKMLLRWINKEKKLRPTVTARGYRLLRACLNWAEGRDDYEGIVNVDRLFKNSEIKKALPKSKPKQDGLMKQQVSSWFEAVRAIDNPVISFYLQALLLTGARRDELARLTWDDVDFRWGSLKIKDKVEGERIIPLTPFVAQLLNDLPRRNEYVFSSPQAKSGRLQDPYRSHVDALNRAELPHVTIHGLRRSFGSLSEWCECPVGVVAQIQGHKPSATAEKHYRVRPLDLLQMWHNKIEAQILEFAGLEQPQELREGMRVAK